MGPVRTLSSYEALSALWGRLGTTLRRRLAACTLLMLFASAAELVAIGALLPFLALLVHGSGEAPLPLIDGMLPEGLMGDVSLQWALVLFGAAAITSTLFRLFTLSYSQRTALEIGHRLGCQVFGQVIRQPYSVQLRRDPAEILATAQKVSRVTWSLLLPVMNGVVGAAVALPITALLLLLEPVGVGIAVVVLGSGYLLISWISRPRLDASSRLVAEAGTAKMAVLQQAVGGIRDILISHSQAAIEARYKECDMAGNRGQGAVLFMVLAPRYVVEAIAIILMCVFALYFVSRDGDFIAAVPILGALTFGAHRLLPVLQQVYVGWSEARGNMQSLKDLLVLLDEEVPEEPAGPVEPLPFRDHIRMDQVTLDYGERQPALREVSLVIPRGARVGLIGPSGCGKSTLIDVITGLLLPTAGQVRVDGVALAPDTVAAWQTRVAVVPQDVYLANLSVAANIALGEEPERIDQARLREAARQARIDGLIDSLPDGYDTRVGERGVSLSGGQRQRIAIARAFYRVADVLIFDEPTSALDAEAETEIMATIAALPADVTVILATHRASPLGLCDLVVRLDHGRVISVEGPLLASVTSPMA